MRQREGFVLREQLAIGKEWTRVHGGHWGPAEGDHPTKGFLSIGWPSVLVSWGSCTKLLQIWVA